MWTIEKVKAELPDVKVRIDTQVKTAQVRGRSLQFPIVGIGSHSWEFSWQTITDALNNGKPLRV